jgi:hypothetical protein
MDGIIVRNTSCCFRGVLGVLFTLTKENPA